MKNFIYYSLFAITLFSCSEDLAESLYEDLDQDPNDALLEGTFSGASGHVTSGKAYIYAENDTYRIVLSDFQSDNGPDLNVYLSDSLNASGSYHDLGDLKTLSGEFSYTFSTNIDLSSLNKVLIWCVDFSVRFGSAELQ